MHPGGLSVCAVLLTLAVALARAEARPLVVSTDESEPQTLDPHKSFGDRSNTLLAQMYDGLVRFTNEGKLEPALAVSWKRVNPLATEFTLREGVAFHDGAPFDAAAVKFSLDRMLAALDCPVTPLLAPIERVEVLGPHRLVIRTARPDGLLLYRLAAFTRVVPPKAARDPGFARRPVGTGPFRFVRWVERDRIELEANPAYWEAGYPRVERLTFRFMPQDRMREALLAGEVDVVPYLPGTWSLEVTRNPRTQLVKALSWVTYLGSLNTVTGPLRSREARLALNHAIDRDRLVRFYSKGNGRPLATTSMAGEFGQDPALEPYAYDRELAKKLLAQAGYPDGLKLKFLVKDTARSVMGVLMTQWAEVGVRVEPAYTTDARMIEDLRREPWHGFFAQTTEPMAHMGFLPAIGVYSKGPFALVRDHEFDAAFERMSAELDMVRQEQLCHELDRRMQREAYNIVTFQQIRTIGVSRAVRFVPSVTAEDRYMHTRWAEGGEGR